MPTALITGVTGFVGSHLAEYLLWNTDWDVVGMMRWDDRQDNIQTLIPLANHGKRLKLVNGDLRDCGSLREVMQTARPDYVFHLAAQSFPLTSFTAPTDAIETNTLGTLNLLDVVREYAPEAWVHICSSSEVYGRVPESLLPIKEDCPFHPSSPYAISKVGADLLAQHYAEAYNVRAVITRMFTHTGPRRGDVFAESSFAKQIAMIEAGQMKLPIRVGNLNSLRTVADVRDAVKAYHMLLTVNPQRGEVYNIGGTHTCTVGQVLETLLSIAGVDYDIIVDPARLRPVDADAQIPDCSKFKNHTGWEPEISFEQTMKDLLQFWRARVKTTESLIR